MSGDKFGTKVSGDKFNERRVQGADGRFEELKGTNVTGGS